MDHQTQRLSVRSLNDLKLMRSVLLAQGANLDKGGQHNCINRPRIRSDIKKAINRHDRIVNAVLAKNTGKSNGEIKEHTLQVASGKLLSKAKSRSLKTNYHFNHFQLGVVPDINGDSLSPGTSAVSINDFSSANSLRPDDNFDGETDEQNNRAHRNWRDAACTLHSVIRIGINRGLIGGESGEDSMGTLSLIDLVKSCSSRAREYQLKTQHADKQSSEIELKSLLIFSKPPVERTEAELKTLMSFISHWPYFQRFSPSIRQELCQVAELETFSTGKKIVSEGDKAVYRYILVSGIAEVLNRSEFRSQKQSGKVVEVARGQSFDAWVNEAGNRSATIICMTTVKVLRLDFDDFEKAVERAKQAECRMKLDFLRKAELLRVFNDFEIKKLAEYCQIKSVPAGTTVLREGEINADLWFLVEVHISVFYFILNLLSPAS
jgi:CRP-like cAMP-binding protein